MTIDIEYYRKLNNSYGVSNKKEIMVNKAKNQIAKTFDSNPLAFEVKINGIEQITLITTSSKDNKKTIISNPNESFNQGDIVEWESIFWIIKDIEPYHDIFTKGTLLECLSSLKWMDEFGGIHETPFAMESDTLSNFGVEEGRIITLSKERRNIFIQKNIHTATLQKEKRFIFDDRVWEVTGVSRLKSGLINMVLEEGQFDTTKDNISLRIANYTAPSYELIMDKTSVSLSQTETLQLNVQVKNNGTLIPSPTLSYLSSDKLICIVDRKGLISPITEGTATITVAFKDVMKVIDVVVENVVSHNYTVEVLDNANSNKFTITKSKSKTLTCVFKDNGLEIAMDGVFSLSDVNGNTTTLATITSQTASSCVVRGDGIGYVLLNVSSVDGLIKGSKQIRIKNAI